MHHRISWNNLQKNNSGWVNPHKCTRIFNVRPGLFALITAESILCNLLKINDGKKEFNKQERKKRRGCACSETSWLRALIYEEISCSQKRSLFEDVKRMVNWRRITFLCFVIMIILAIKCSANFQQQKNSF